MKPKGYLSMILHAHLPYVRHPERENHLEESWLYEAITETYLPLLLMLQRLERDGVPCRLAMSVTPTLGCMLQDTLLRERFNGHLDKMVELSHKEKERTRFQPRFYELAQMYLDIFTRAKRAFNHDFGGDLVQAFRMYQEKGLLEILASCATHGFLPLMVNPQAIDAQIGVGVNWYRAAFGRDPQGFWLPECGYYPGIERQLRNNGVQYVICDTHGVLHSKPRPRYAVYAPVYCPAGLAFFGRDHESSKQVWSSTEGYPGDFDYREFYRDIGFDCDFDYVQPYLPGGVRGNTGMKYYRITGKTNDKQPYNPQVAAERAANHAGNFMFNREKQVEYLSGYMDRPPIIVAPYDAELFGHWWFEGPQWLEFLIRKVAFDQHTVQMITPGEYLQQYSCNQVTEPSLSTWGNNGYNAIWLDDCNDWIYPHLTMIADKMVELANVETEDTVFRRALNQAAREVLLAQSSDWAFIMKAGTMVEYATYRTNLHVDRFWQIYRQVLDRQIDQQFLEKVEHQDNIFPDIDYRVFRQRSTKVG